MFLGRIVKNIFQRYSKIRTLRKSGETALLEKHFASLSDQASQKMFKEASSVFNAGTLEERRMCYSMTEDIIQKLEMCSDSKIKESAMRIMQEAEGKSNQEIYNAMNKAEALLDSVNMAENKYSVLFDISKPMGNIGRDTKALKAQAEKLNNAVKSGEKDEAEKIAEDLYENYSQPRQAYYALKRSNKTDEVLSSEFDLSSRYSRMRDFFLWAPQEKDMANYLYKKYFLREIKQGNFDLQEYEKKEMISLLQTINKKYNTKVFLDKADYYTKEALIELKDEFNIWAKVSRGKAQFPLVYESNRNFKPRAINGDIVGDANFYLKRIRVEDITKSGGSFRGYNPNRHEMVHLNDTHISDNGNCDKITIPEWQKLEMEKAGISKSHIEYGETNIKEKRAVILEGDISSYSQKFKDDIVNIDKVEPYMTQLCSHREFFEQALRRKYSTAQDNKIIDKIKQSFVSSVYHDEIPVDVSKAILKNKELLTVAQDVISAKGEKYHFTCDFIHDCEKELSRIEKSKRRFRRKKFDKEHKQRQYEWRQECKRREAERAKRDAETKKLLAELDQIHRANQEWLDKVRAMRAQEEAQFVPQKTILDRLKEAQSKVETFDADDKEIKTFIDLFG